MERAIAHAWIHPNFESTYYTHDIAIVELESPIDTLSFARINVAPFVDLSIHVCAYAIARRRSRRWLPCSRFCICWRTCF